ncbi:hypothetical protein PN36_04015 [Candidatus Thiomargarita nelsonii]|uniref:ATPase domain protein, prokaryote domain protein n=1 Tax=Candidatus Thiomargarita nelsonii TaxID=1003181 RepID=A0A0A6PM85_9GAMM|nr:hypothetical protein PN36_04015 [Candidatus Thiomargarita nelsonii]
MQYPLTEKIGQPELLVGREKEFRQFQKWLDKIPDKLSKSRVILARRKSGKTVFVQRIFNQLWNENGLTIPFFFDVADTKIWYPTAAIDYYCAFASQYISFLERDEKLVNKRLSLEDIRKYGKANAIGEFVDDVDFLLQNKEVGGCHDLMWKTACSAPHRFADFYEKRFLVIIDEFQNLTRYVYPDPLYQTAPIETLAGSFHSLSESKIAPMLVTGSYVGWLLLVIRQYLEAGRLKQIRFSPYLTQEEGLQAVYKYAQFYNEPITNETAVQINELCMSDPFFISCVIQNELENKDLTSSSGVIERVNYEISDRRSEMSETWNEYLQLTLKRINDRHAKNMLLHLSKHAYRYWTPRDLKAALSLPLDINQIQDKLLILSEADMIEQGVADIDFRGLQDGTLNLILRNRFEKEITESKSGPNLKLEFEKKIETLTAKNQQLQGQLNHLSGKMAEHLLATAFRSRKRFALSDFFQEVIDTTRLNIIEVKEGVFIQRSDGKKMEIDVVAQSSCGRVVLIEVKKRQAKTGQTIVEDFQEKVEVYKKQFPEQKILPAFLSLGGFTEDARHVCQTHEIGWAETIRHY